MRKELVKRRIIYWCHITTLITNQKELFVSKRVYTSTLWTKINRTDDVIWFLFHLFIYKLVGKT